MSFLYKCLEEVLLFSESHPPQIVMLFGEKGIDVENICTHTSRLNCTQKRKILFLIYDLFIKFSKHHNHSLYALTCQEEIQYRRRDKLQSDDGYIMASTVQLGKIKISKQKTNRQIKKEKKRQVNEKVNV